MAKRNIPDYSALPDEVLLKTLIHLQARIAGVSKELAERFVPAARAAPTFGWAAVHHSHISLTSIRANRPRLAPPGGRLAFVQIAEVTEK